MVALSFTSRNCASQACTNSAQVVIKKINCLIRHMRLRNSFSTIVQSVLQQQQRHTSHLDSKHEATTYVESHCCENIQVPLRSYIGLSQTKQRTTKHDRHSQQIHKQLTDHKSLKFRKLLLPHTNREVLSVSSGDFITCLTLLFLERKMRSFERRFRPKAVPPAV